MQLASLRRKWRSAGLPPVLYHSTFIDNIPLIVSELRLTANKGNSICRSRNGFVSLSDRITRGIAEFFGNVVFEFDAPSLYAKNELIAPVNYSLDEDEVERYDEIPFFENEWRSPEAVMFELNDIRKLLLLTSKDFPQSAFESLAALLKDTKISHSFLLERWLSDKISADTARYFFRLEGWKKFFYLTSKKSELTV